MPKDPVCGMDIAAESAAAQETYQGATWYFCSASCHEKFLANPGQYVPAQTLTDPVCGMEITRDSAHHLDYAGRQYYFCSDSCLEKFRANPGAYT